MVPGDSEKILLILDLDETLIHATTKKLDIAEADFQFDDYWVYKRPFLDEFLLSVKEDFKVAVWSSAGDKYVVEIVKNIFPADYELQFVWGRTKCTMKKDIETDTFFHSKPLKKLKRKGHNLERILIVDDSREKVKENYGNAIYIKEFIGEHDSELKKLSVYLQQLKGHQNLRLIEKRGWSFLK